MDLYFVITRPKIRTLWSADCFLLERAREGYFMYYLSTLYGAGGRPEPRASRVENWDFFAKQMNVIQTIPIARVENLPGFCDALENARWDARLIVGTITCKEYALAVVASLIDARIIQHNLIAFETEVDTYILPYVVTPSIPQHSSSSI